MDEENGEQSGAGSNQSQQTETGSSNTKENSQKVQQAIKSASKKGAMKQSLMAALSHILIYVFAAIVILIIIIGLIMFFVTMPGMVMEKIKALFKALGNYIAAFYGADTTEQIDSADVYETLDYLEQMGYDLKGYGFLTDYIKSEDEVDGSADTSNGVILDEATGVLRDTDDKIITAKSDYIYTYIASDNYVYTLKNDNLATQESADNWFEKIGAAIATAWYKVENFFYGPVFDFLGVTNAVGETWGKGLIGLYYEKGTIGENGQFVNQGTFWNWDSIKINLENKTLQVKRRTLLDANNNAIEFSLDGWTGRYGMPVEFLLSVHLATMMPDLAVDMVKNFPTEIQVYLHDVTGDATAGYKVNQDGADKYIDYEVIQKVQSGFAGKNVFTAVINWIDNWFESSSEVEAARQLGIDVGTGEGNCTCELEDGFASNDGYVVVKDGDNWKYASDFYSSDDPETLVHKEGDLYEGDVEEIHVVGTACDYCKRKLSGINKYLGENNDYYLKAYTPYISKVKNHWYRDVYFVLNSSDMDKNFIEYDYEYEALVKERWTLYETYTNNPSDGYRYNPEKEGEFILYEINEDGTYKKDGDNYVLYNGTQEEARKNNVAVVKKAKELDINEEKLLDLGWNKNTDDVWSAYDTEDTTSGYEPLFSEDEINEEEDEVYKEVMKKSYINLNLTGNIVQTGDGLREETNPQIKKMFLQNKYFRYDGSTDTAEIITELRKKVAENHNEKVYYTALTDDDMDISIEKEKEGKKEKYSVAEYSGTVSLNQDSLNAFSMLENTHTLDADYIYRDFKELIVELGYFEKEELTDETPRLLQWIVPDIGSGGYPRRSIDKRENEYGTMVHSKSDIEVNDKNSLYQLIAQMEEQNPENGNVPEPEDKNYSGIPKTSNSNNLSQVKGIHKNSDVEPDDILSSNDSNINFKNVKGTGASFVLERVQESGDGYESIVKSGNVEYIHRYQGGQSYSDITFTWAGQTKTLGRAACGLFSCFNVLTGYGYEFDPTKDLPGFNWGATMDAVKTLMDEKGVPGQFIESTDTAALDAALNEGRPAILLVQSTTDKQGVTWTSGGHFIALVGKDADGNILTLDSAAQGNVKRHDYPGTVEDMQPAFQSAPIWIADEPPTGMKKGEGNPYEGYEGNEAVVSPVTGVLLEYGTYTDEDVDSITNEKYRVNVDLKYGLPNKIESEENGESGENEEPNPDPENGTPTEEEQEIVSDKVGYAKILVLDAENYQKLESATNNSWKDNSLVKIRQIASDDDDDEKKKTKATFLERLSKKEELEDKNLDENKDDPWSEIDKTIYGYKEFAERYEQFGIAGYIVYIDGFVCELPDENLAGSEGNSGSSGDSSDGTSDTTSKDISEQIPNGKKLDMSSFKVTESELESAESEEDDENKPQTKYEKDDEYKLASQKATDKLNAETEVKDQANTAITINSDGEDLIFIKEGTVIGRTMTDKELLEGENFRAGKYGTYDELRSKSKNKDTSDTDTSKENDKDKNDEELIGNYIRIIMRDLDGTVVENVEDYMKLDEEDGKKHSANDWELFYWLPFECYGVDLPGRGPECQGTCSSGETAVGIIQWTVLTSKNMNNISSQFIPGCLEYDSNLCAPLAAYQSWSANDFWNDYNGAKQFQATLKQICATDRDGFLAAQMDVAKKQYLDPILEEYPWLAERPSCVQGEIMHLKVWGANYSWISSYQNSSDEEIILKVRNTIANTSSTAGSASGDESSGRAYNEPQIALEILNGSATLEDVEQWVRQQDYSVFNFTFK